MTYWLQTKPGGEIAIRRWWRGRGQPVLWLAQRGTFPVAHPSTRLSLRLLVEAQRELQPAAMVDVGCGSGILALFGARLGISWVVGCDLAWRAVEVSQRNAQRNGLAARSSWLQGSTEALGFSFSLVVANLPWEVQAAKRLEFLRLLARPGGLILAGFREVQEDQIRDFYLRQGLRLVRRLTQEAWEPEPPAALSYTWVGLYFRWG